MPNALESFEAFVTANEVLTYLSKALSNKLNKTTPSADPTSDYAKLDSALRTVMDARMALAAAKLKQINDDIAASGLVDDINEAAADAKKEAERIKKATKVVSDLIAVVEKITAGVGLVGKLLAL